MNRLPKSCPENLGRRRLSQGPSNPDPLNHIMTLRKKKRPVSIEGEREKKMARNCYRSRSARRVRPRRHRILLGGEGRGGPPSPAVAAGRRGASPRSCSAIWFFCLVGNKQGRRGGGRRDQGRSTATYADTSLALRKPGPRGPAQPKWSTVCICISDFLFFLFFFCLEVIFRVSLA